MVGFPIGSCHVEVFNKSLGRFVLTVVDKGIILSSDTFLREVIAFAIMCRNFPKHNGKQQERDGFDSFAGTSPVSFPQCCKQNLSQEVNKDPSCSIGTNSKKTAIEHRQTSKNP